MLFDTSMRITGGKAKSIPLLCPKGDSVRPATDRMRESVFSSIGPAVSNSVVLDLFAGTGSYGLECLSRGAQRGVFVERQSQALSFLKKNIAAVVKSAGLDPSQAQVHSMDVLKYLAQPRDAQLKFDLVFVDPPYALVADHYLEILKQLESILGKEGATLVFESPFEFETIPEPYTVRKVYGKGREDSRCMVLAYPGK
jgi:16S rRNA (guanine966-N2)-methyltransferase